MKLSLHATTIGAAIFAVLCLGAGISGLLSLDLTEDAAQMADARGFAWFWTFLGIVGVLVALLSSWLARSPERSANAKPVDESELT